MSIYIISPAIGPVTVSAVLSEQHSQGMDVTMSPVEFGSPMTDHAQLQPVVVTLTIADRWAVETFNSIIRLQRTRRPFTLLTGLRRYANMLITNIDVTRDADTSTVLMATVECTQVIIGETRTTRIKPSSSNRAASVAQRGDNVATTPTAKQTPDIKTATLGTTAPNGWSIRR